MKLKKPHGQLLSLLFILNKIKVLFLINKKTRKCGLNSFNNFKQLQLQCNGKSFMLFSMFVGINAEIHYSQIKSPSSSSLQRQREIGRLYPLYSEYKEVIHTLNRHIIHVTLYVSPLSTVLLLFA